MLGRATLRYCPHRAPTPVGGRALASVNPIDTVHSLAQRSCNPGSSPGQTPTDSFVEVQFALCPGSRVFGDLADGHQRAHAHT